MRPPGWITLGVALSLVALPIVAAAQTPPSTVPASALTLSLPGPLEGCSYLDTAANDSLRAVLDLVRPSAFATTVQGELVGAAGPITQAQLISLAPQTVAYTLAPGWRWTDGRAFTADDLLYWYQHARGLRAAAADGYRAISTLTPSADGLTVTAVFATPFAMWNTLFRDINERGTPPACRLSSVARQASLGPYRVQSLTAQGAVLVRNPLWRGTPARIATVVVHTNGSAWSSSWPSVDYRTWASLTDLDVLADSPRRAGYVGTSNQIVTVAFSPHRATTFQLAVRQFLALSLDRQALVDQLIGSISYSQGLAASVLYAQGQTDYPGTEGVGPSVQGTGLLRTTIPTNAGTDCVVCAAAILREGGFHQRQHRWLDATGHLLRIHLAVGPSPIERSTAALLAAQWGVAGVTLSRTYAPSDLAVARLLARGRSDAGVMTITASTQPAVTARSWTGVNYGDTLDVGWRSPLIDQWYAAAQDTFNPRDAVSNFAEIDQYVTTQQWERPLFTEPSILTWSSDVQGVYQSPSMFGLVDQLPSWGIAAVGKTKSTKR